MHDLFVFVLSFMAGMRSERMVLMHVPPPRYLDIFPCRLAQLLDERDGEPRTGEAEQNSAGPKLSLHFLISMHGLALLSWHIVTHRPDLQQPCMHLSTTWSNNFTNG